MIHRYFVFFKFTIEHFLCPHLKNLLFHCRRTFRFELHVSAVADWDSMDRVITQKRGRAF